MNGMNPWCALGASILCVWAASACSDSSPAEPAGQSGGPGAVGGDGGSGDSGSAGASGKSGSGPQGGSAAGTPAGGSHSAGTSGGGGASAGAAGSSEGGSGGEAPSGPYRAVMGQVCPVESTIGVVELMGFPEPYVQVSLFNRADPLIGAPELSTSTCDFHRYEPGLCDACEAGEVCSPTGECGPERRTIKDATLEVETGGAQRSYSADPQLGGIYSTLDIGDADSSYSMRLSWNEMQVLLEPMPVASADLADVAVVTESDDYDMPGALDATWRPGGSGAFVRSRIPINHHAGGPTFTECRAPESSGAFHADAAMINPLAVQTGLEFQGLEHVFVAAATTPQGCVELRFGARISAFPL
jgi:hypothetical protein